MLGQKQQNAFGDSVELVNKHEYGRGKCCLEAEGQCFHSCFDPETVSIGHLVPWLWIEGGSVNTVNTLSPPFEFVACAADAFLLRRKQNPEKACALLPGRKVQFDTN